MIEKLMEKWHQNLNGELPGGIDELLADDVKFYSPIVFTPVKGKELAKSYLGAGGNTFSGGKTMESLGADDSKFKYTKEVVSGYHAVLEFEVEVEGKYVNGVDIITCNDEAKIIELKVMLRPLQEINIMHEQMKKRLDKLQKSGQGVYDR